MKDIRGRFRAEEERKYEYLHKRLNAMLVSKETYDEGAWQAEILQIVLLLNPRYIAAFGGADQGLRQEHHERNRHPSR